jgi:choline dehydrogenase-like flavoprotein
VLASPAGKHFLPEALRKLYVGEGKHRYIAHISNVIRTLIPTAAEAFRIFTDRYWSKSRKPTIFLRNASGRYTLHYHSEQTPDAENRLRLSDEIDAFGLPRVEIDFRYSKADALVILRAHAIVDTNLRASGIGYLEFPDAESVRADAILEQARDGMHQIGAARMARDPSAGVVDGDCKVHGIDNLFLASTCTFPTSGQANPTFLGVALAFRLADHLAMLRGTSP